MSSRLLRAAMIAAALTFALVLPAFAHSGGEASGISVEPAQVTAGGTVVLAGNDLEPNSDREINLVGTDVIVPFPKVTTDADGMFAVTLTIPGHLPSGMYTFQAIGDETLTTDITVTAAAGMTATEPAGEVATVIPRSYSTLEIGIIGLLLAWRSGLVFCSSGEPSASTDGPDTTLRLGPAMKRPGPGNPSRPQPFNI